MADQNHSYSIPFKCDFYALDTMLVQYLLESVRQFVTSRCTTVMAKYKISDYKAQSSSFDHS